MLCSKSGFLNTPNNDFFNLDTAVSSSPNTNLASKSISNLSRPIEEWSAKIYKGTVMSFSPTFKVVVFGLPLLSK